MRTVNVYEAKTSLSSLLSAVERGEEIVIARKGRPIARLVAMDGDVAPNRGFGIDRGLFEVPDDFDAPLPEEVLTSFER